MPSWRLCVSKREQHVFMGIGKERVVSFTNKDWTDRFSCGTREVSEMHRVQRHVWEERSGVTISKTRLVVVVKLIIKMGP